MKKLFFFYGAFLFCLTCFSYLFIDPNFFYLHTLFTNFSQSQRLVTTMLFLSSIVIFYTFYFLFLSSAKKITKKNLFILLGLPASILLFAYPAMLSFDIFNYVATAKVTFFYHENPYIIMPIEFTKDPLLLFLHAGNKTALYAPFWLLIAGIPFFLGFGNLLLTLITFKVFVGLFYLLAVVLLWKMTQSTSKTLFFALNPLVVIETFISGHNDIVMMALLLLSIYFFLNKKLGKGIVLFLLSLGIKYATGILLPLVPFLFLKKIPQQKLFTWITIGMTGIFLLSSLREEIYPWYAIWILLPGTFLSNNMLIKFLLIGLSFGLLLRYLPFMLLGTYFGPTPLAKVVLMLLPIIVVSLWFGSRAVRKHMQMKG